jgi:hypothetical protein
MGPPGRTAGFRFRSGEPMEILRKAAGCLAMLIMLSTISLAQDCKATLNFPATPNGDVSIEILLKNSDGQNSGSGDITSYNGQEVKWTVAWERIPGNVVVITRDGVLLGAMRYPLQALGGEARLNDGGNNGNGSPGTWTRN